MQLADSLAMEFRLMALAHFRCAAAIWILPIFFFLGTLHIPRRFDSIPVSSISLRYRRLPWTPTDNLSSLSPMSQPAALGTASPRHAALVVVPDQPDRPGRPGPRPGLRRPAHRWTPPLRRCAGARAGPRGARHAPRTRARFQHGSRPSH